MSKKIFNILMFLGAFAVIFSAIFLSTFKPELPNENLDLAAVLLARNCANNIDSDITNLELKTSQIEEYKNDLLSSLSLYYALKGDIRRKHSYQSQITEMYFRNRVDYEFLKYKLLNENSQTICKEQESYYLSINIISYPSMRALLFYLLHKKVEGKVKEIVPYPTQIETSFALEKSSSTRNFCAKELAEYAIKFKDADAFLLALKNMSADMDRVYLVYRAILVREMTDKLKEFTKQDYAEENFTDLKILLQRTFSADRFMDFKKLEKLEGISVYTPWKFRFSWLVKDWKAQVYPLLAYHAYLRNKPEIYKHYIALALKKETLDAMRPNFKNYLQYLANVLIFTGKKEDALNLILENAKPDLACELLRTTMLNFGYDKEFSQLLYSKINELRKHYE